jgi:LPPG:FO 2-phospho-L-lactate transferase
MKIVAFAGGVGGAKLIDGLAQNLPAEDLTVVVNTGDDFIYSGLYIAPDLDSVCYTLAGIANPATGWGRVDESWNVLDALDQLGAPTWFSLGDRHLATHLERTRRMNNGEPLSVVTEAFCQAWGVLVRVLPMSDDPVATMVYSEGRELAFQDYFVREACQPVVRGFRFAGSDAARPTPGILSALSQADAVIFCPSNPWVSIDPILSISAIREGIQTLPVVAVSPLIGGQAVKGPAAKMYAEMGIQPSARAVARHYRELLTGFVLDESDREESMEIERWGIIPYATDIMMRDIPDRKRLAGEVLEFTRLLLEGKVKQ